MNCLPAWIEIATTVARERCPTVAGDPPSVSTRSTLARFGCVLCFLILWGRISLSFASPASGDSAVAAEIRPILSANCFHCHGQDPNTRKAKLRLDTLEGQRANDVVVPGQPGKSELIRRIFTTDPDDQMPPPDAHRASRAPASATR